MPGTKAIIKGILNNYEFGYGSTEGSKDRANVDVRNNYITWLHLNNDTLWVYEKIKDLVYRANKQTWNFNITGFYEDIQYSIYDNKEEGSHYTWHMDIGSEYPMNYRKISVSIQMSLEEEYEGAELQLNQGAGEITATKEIGSALVFPSYMLHRVTPIIKGKRESLQLWVSGIPFQ